MVLMSVELTRGRAVDLEPEAVAVVARLRDTVVTEVALVVQVVVVAAAAVVIVVVAGASLVCWWTPECCSLRASEKSELTPAADLSDEAAGGGCSLAEPLAFELELALAAGVASSLAFGGCTSGMGLCASDEAPEVEGSAKCLRGTLVGTETPIASETFAEPPPAALLLGTCPLSCEHTHKCACACVLHVRARVCSEYNRENQQTGEQ